MIVEDIFPVFVFLQDCTSGVQMDKKSQIVLKSLLNPEQLRVQQLYQLCGVKIEPKTLIHIWKLCELGIPPQLILALVHDIAKYPGSSKK